MAALVREKNTTRSYEQMAIAAKQKGGYSRASFNKLARGRTRLPEEQHIPAIAAGLGITEAELKEAIARQAGVHVEHGIDSTLSGLLNVVSDLSRANRERFYRLARALAQTLAAEEPPVETLTRDSEGRPITGEHTRALVDLAHDRVEQEADRRGGERRRANG